MADEFTLTRPPVRRWQGPLPLRQLMRRLGPGVITGAADDDPSGIATYSQIGAQFGYALGWTVVLTTPLMAAVQEIAARIGRVTGAGLGAAMRDHAPRWLTATVITALVAANIFNLGADIGAMAEACKTCAEECRKV